MATRTISPTMTLPFSLIPHKRNEMSAQPSVRTLFVYFVLLHFSQMLLATPRPTNTHLSVTTPTPVVCYDTSTTRPYVANLLDCADLMRKLNEQPNATSQQVFSAGIVLRRKEIELPYKLVSDSSFPMMTDPSPSEYTFPLANS